MGTSFSAPSVLITQDGMQKEALSPNPAVIDSEQNQVLEPGISSLNCYLFLGFDACSFLWLI
jgi:hypothetical protein